MVRENPTVKLSDIDEPDCWINLVTNEYHRKFSIAIVSTTKVSEIADMGLDEELY